MKKKLYACNFHMKHYTFRYLKMFRRMKTICAKMQFIEFLGKDEFQIKIVCIKDVSCIKNETAITQSICITCGCYRCCISSFTKQMLNDIFEQAFRVRAVYLRKTLVNTYFTRSYQLDFSLMRHKIEAKYFRIM